MLGALTGLEAPVQLGPAVMRRIRIAGIMTDCRRALRDLVAFVEERDLRPVLDREYPLAALPHALELMERGEHFGEDRRHHPRHYPRHYLLTRGPGRNGPTDTIAAPTPDAPSATFLVPGGAGFIGSHFIEMLLARYPDCRVITLDKLTYAGSLDNLGPALADPRHEFVHGDICDPALVGPLATRADYLINFAAETHVDRAILDGEAFARTDTLGAAVLLEAFRRSDRGRLFLQVSTDEVYGEILEGDVAEEAPLAPKNPYAASKAGGDLLALAYRATHRLPVVISRGANTYGPRQHAEKMTPTFLARALAGEALPVYGDGRQVRDWLFVSDHCAALDLLLRSGVPGAIYNVGSGDRRTNLDMADRILDVAERATGRRGRIAHVADRPGHDRRYSMDTTRIRRLGWAPETSLEEGLGLTCDWIRKQQAEAAVGAQAVPA